MRLNRFVRVIPAIVVLGFTTSLIALAGDPKPASNYNPTVHKDNGEGEKAIKRFQYDKSLKVDLWASEPLLANPVAFCFDEKGRCYVAETFRHSAGVTDNRGHPSKWTDDDLAARTVADRLALYKKHLGAKYDTYGGHDDRIRLLEDTDG